jgi:hypothetical protein
VSLQETLESYTAHERDKVLSATWGHLAPELGTYYYGSIVFAHGAYGGNTAVLSISFATRDGVELEDSPWAFEDLTDYVTDWICDQANGYRNHKPIPDAERVDPDGKVFRFTGSYCRFKNNNCRIHGKFTELSVVG